MNRSMTTEELFNRIQDILKEKGRIPSILDYGLAARRPVPVRTYEFDLISKLANGAVRVFIWICGLSILPTAG